LPSCRSSYEHKKDATRQPLRDTPWVMLIPVIL